MTTTSSITESRVELSGVRTRVLEVDGDGPPILLMHGFTDSADSWRPLLGRFAAARRRAVAVDLPGSGWAAHAGRPYISTMDEFVVAFLHRYAHSGAILVGNSLGGLLALRAAQRDDLPVRGVVGVSPAGLTYGPRLEFLTRWMRPINIVMQVLGWLPIPRKLLQRAARQLYDVRLSEGRADAELSRYYAAHLRSMRDVRRIWGDIRAIDADGPDVLDLDRIVRPVLLIWGRHDPLTLVEGAQLVIDALPDTQLVVLDDCGHCAQIQRPDQVAELIVDFTTSSATTPTP